MAAMRWRLCLSVCLLAGCGAETRALVQSASPKNGSSAVLVATKPTITFTAGVTLDARSRRVVLYDVTAGARLTVAGTVEVEGSVVTYSPKDLLAAGREFELEVQRGAASWAEGGDISERDGSESPEEDLLWPYRLRFSTQSRPRVRAAYLERDDETFRVVVHFSQAMNPLVTGPEISVLDMASAPVKGKVPLWSGSDMARMTLTSALDAASLYVLKVGRKSTATDGTLLDGDADGTCGEASDDYSVQFTGSQPVIRSRLK